MYLINKKIWFVSGQARGGLGWSNKRSGFFPSLLENEAIYNPCFLAIST
jgi:hypothetical protein